MAQYKGAASEGARAMNLMKKREQQRQELEKMKQKIAEVRSCNWRGLHTVLSNFYTRRNMPLSQILRSQISLPPVSTWWRNS